MKFKYTDYNYSYNVLIDSWLDEEAIRQTGIDNGFQDFYDYWMGELKSNFWCKIIFLNNKPIGIFFIDYVLDLNSYHLSEFIINPNLRNKGYGTKIINDLISNSDKIIGKSINKINAVVFAGNIASQKMFEKLEFKLDKIHEDKTVLYYSKKIER